MMKTWNGRCYVLSNHNDNNDPVWIDLTLLDSGVTMQSRSDRSERRQQQRERVRAAAAFWDSLPEWLYAGEKAIPQGTFPTRRNDSGILRQDWYGEAE